MAINLTCPTCGNSIQVPESWVGRKGRCKKCGNVITVPGSAVEPQAGQPAVEPVAVMPDYPPTPAGFGPGPVTPIQVQAMAAPGEELLPQAQIVAAPTSGPGGGMVAARELAAVKAMVDRGSYLDATRALNTLESSASGNPAFYYLRGLAYGGIGNFPLALDDLNRAVQNGVRTPEVFATKGRAELSLSRYEPAIESLDTALELAGTDIPDYMADLAKAYDGARMPRDAAATWAALAQINPNHPAILQRQRERDAQQAMRHQQQAQMAMVQMQKEQQTSNTACWICIILRICMECM